MAARWMASKWDARLFAAIDPEEFYDFAVTRPEVHLTEDFTRRIDWPEGKLLVASPTGSAHDVVFLHATEPQLRWRTYAATVVGVATTLGVELAVTLGGFGTDVAHTRPVRVTGTAGNPELVKRLGLQRSRYEGPTGLVAVLHEALGQAGIPSASLWANVPHYVLGTPSPKAALALVERTVNLLGVPMALDELETASAAYERQVNKVVAGDGEITAYVRHLEDMDPDDPENLNWPYDNSLADEVERFLRDQSPE